MTLLTEEVVNTVERCEQHADEHFSGEDRFVETCLWDDGDFRVMVQHSFDRDENEPMKHRAERITFKKSAGRVLYVRYVQDLLGRKEEVEEQYVIEELDL